jgi:cell division protein FtsA
MSKENVQYYTGLEVGSSKVAMALGRISGDKLELVAFAQVPHKGIHQGQIVDAREISSAIHKAKSELEVTANCQITSAIASVADLTIESLHAKGVLSVKKSIAAKDIDTIKAVAEDLVPLRSDRQILHHFPQFYKVGSQKHVEAPIGEKTTSFEMHSTLIVGSKKLLQTIRDCALQSQIQISEFVDQTIASSQVLLTEEEKEKGVVLVDIGSSMTHLLVYKAGKVVFSQTLPIGGANFTNDLAVGLRTPQLAAEKIKKNHGAALVDLVSEGEMVEIESLKGEAPRTVEARFVCEILEARAEETIGLILRKLNNEDLLSHIKSGLVLTGGGSQLPGLPELGEFTFDMAMRRGGLRDILSANPLGQGPAMSVVVGLLQHATKRQSFETSEFSMVTFKETFTNLKKFFENIL